MSDRKAEIRARFVAEAARIGEDPCALAFSDEDVQSLEEKVNDFCCTAMQGELARTCAQHEDRRDCADNVITVAPDGGYGILIHDGGHSYYRINFCPWCGKKLSRADADVVQDAVAGSMEPMTRAQLVTATGLSDEDVRVAVEVLVAVGEVEVDAAKRVRIAKP